MRTSRAAWRAAVVLTAGLGAAHQPPVSIPPFLSSAQAPSATSQATPRTGTGVIVGIAWRADSSPYPDAIIGLRSVTDGREVARVVTDRDGEFRFVSVRPGTYIVELRSAQERVVAISDIIVVAEGQTVSTSVRLAARAPWFSGFFGNAAAAAIAAASSLGITALGSNGRPASPQ